MNNFERECELLTLFEPLLPPKWFKFSLNSVDFNTENQLSLLVPITFVNWCVSNISYSICWVKKKDNKNDYNFIAENIRRKQI